MVDNMTGTQKIKQKRRMRLALIVFIIFLGWSMSIIHVQHNTLVEKEKQINQSKESLSKLQKENEQLKQRMILLDDRDYIAEIARKQFFMSKPGEVIFVIPEE